MLPFHDDPIDDVPAMIAAADDVDGSRDDGGYCVIGLLSEFRGITNSMSRLAMNAISRTSVRFAYTNSH